MSYPLIIAYDETSLDKLSELAKMLCGHVAGFKVGLPLMLEHGVKKLRELKSSCSKALWIADVKAADIAHVVSATVTTLLRVFDKVIVHAVVGYVGALEGLKDVRENLVVVVAMSHPGADETLNRLVVALLKVAERVKPWGVVAPATKPELVRLTRQLLGQEVKILSPGVGAQGARPGTALCAGADFEIVGRAIVNAVEPLKAVKKIGEEQLEAVRRCRSAN